MFSAAVIVVTGLLVIPHAAHAIWARLTDAELLEQSEVIVTAELIGSTHMRLSPDQTALRLGVLQVEKMCKGDPNQTLLLLVLPSSEGPRLSTDIFYHKGQRGMWFLRARMPGEVGLYVADHPQRFMDSRKGGCSVYGSSGTENRVKAQQKIIQ